MGQRVVKTHAHPCRHSNGQEVGKTSLILGSQSQQRKEADRPPPHQGVPPHQAQRTVPIVAPVVLSKPLGIHNVIAQNKKYAQ